MTRRIQEHEIEWTSGGSSSLGWFNVNTYGATGDGATDDTTAINDAITALNTAGRGVLYFPTGTYKVTAGLSAITVPAHVLGDGCADALFRNAPTTITTASSTANLFTVSGNGHGTKFDSLSLVNASATAPTAGAGICVTAGDGARYDDVSVRGFYICIDVQDGAEWFMDRCFLYGPVKYGLKVQHIDLPDGGDQAITNCQFIAETYNADAAIRIETGGGLKLTNTKINNRGSARFVRGLDGQISSSTAVCVIHGCSFENMTTNAIRFGTTGGAHFADLVISGLQAAFYTSGSTPAIDISGVDYMSLDGLVLGAGPSRACAAISLTNVNQAVVGDRIVRGFSSSFAQTGSTNVVDGLAGGGAVASVNSKTGVVVLTAADVGAADATHTHPRLEVVMTAGTSSPPIPVETPDGTDWVYAEV